MYVVSSHAEESHEKEGGRVYTRMSIWLVFGCFGQYFEGDPGALVLLVEERHRAALCS